MTTAALNLAVLTLGILGPTLATSPRLPAAPAPAPAAGRPAAAVAAGVWPLSPRPDLVSGFAPPASDYGAGHRGVDLAGRPGQAVRAAVGGRVDFVGMLAGRGVVVVSHGATRTTYEPVRSDVALGDPVVAGQRLGALQSEGSHCAPATCLHWGLLEGDSYLDPLMLVGAGPVRLLPLFSAPALPRPPTTLPYRPMPGDGPGGRPDATGPW